MSTCPARIAWKHREAGAAEVLVSSSQRWALMHELRGAREPRLPELLAKMSRVDLVVVEGFKREPHRKIEVHRAANAKPLLFPDDPDVVGIATDTPVETRLPTAHLDDIEAIAAMTVGRPRHHGCNGLDIGHRAVGSLVSTGVSVAMPTTSGWSDDRALHMAARWTSILRCGSAAESSTTRSTRDIFASSSTQLAAPRSYTSGPSAGWRRPGPRPHPPRGAFQGVAYRARRHRRA